jgi:outer membrane protein assembly factor BamB
MAYRDAPPRSIVVVSTPAGLFGVEPESGRTLWKYDNVPDAGRTSLVAYAGLDDAPCVFFHRAGHLACVHRETGEEIWSVATGVDGGVAMIVDAGRVVLACDAVVECWSFRGEHLWRKSFERGSRGGRAVETVLAVEGVTAHDAS